MKYQFYADPGHGWLRVPKQELIDLGIAKKISHYSYMDGDYAYLEEDCDASIFMDAKGFMPPVEEHHTNSSSPIRRYASYRR